MRISLIPLLLGAIAVSPLANWSLGQEEPQGDLKIEIINQDGEQVQPKIVTATGDAKQEGTAEFRVQQEDGKITITDADGNIRQLNVPGANSIIISKSVQSVDQDGQKESKVTGRAIIVGPDGKRQVIELGDQDGALTLPGLDLDTKGLNGVFQFNRNDNKFMIGVYCEPVGDALASQLRLSPGTGLLVVNVSEDSPAATAGLEKHDILLFANESELSEQENLSKIVQQAGKDKTPVALTVMRNGKEINIEITPAERPAGLVGGVSTLEMDPNVKLFPNMNGDFDFQFKEMGPGVIVGGEWNDQLREQMQVQLDEMRKQMDEMRKLMNEKLGDR